MRLYRLKKKVEGTSVDMTSTTFAKLRSLPFTVTLPDGSTQEYYLGDLDTMMSQYTGTCTVLGCGIGAMVILSVILTIVARSYRSAMFWMHQSSFIFAITQYSILLRQYMEPDHNFAALLTGASLTRYAANIGVAGDFIALGVISSLMTCLGFQIFVAYKNLQNAAIKWCVYGLFFVACAQTLVVWIYELAINTRSNLGTFSSVEDSYVTAWTANALWPSFGATACLGSVMLTWRLFTVARSRAKLGLEQFDAIHIILIAAVQNGTIPALFTILSFHFASNSSFAEGIGILTTMLCCIFFPMGYIWTQAKRWTDIDANRRSDDMSQHSKRAKGTVYWSSLPATGVSEAWATSPSADEEKDPQFISQFGSR